MATKYINTEFEVAGGLNLSSIATGDALSGGETKALFLDANGDIGHRTVGSAAFVNTSTFASSGHTHAFGDLSDKPTSIAGYGITDAVSTSTLSNYVTSSSLSTTLSNYVTSSSLTSSLSSYVTSSSLTSTLSSYSLSDDVTTALGFYLLKSGGDVTGDLSLADGATLNIGSGDDMQLYHDNTYGYNYIHAPVIRLRGNGTEVVNDDNNAYSARFISGGACELYHNGTKRINTTSAGGAIVGDLTISGDLSVTGSFSAAGEQTVPLASSTVIGGGKTAYPSGGDNYGVRLDSTSSSFYVTVDADDVSKANLASRLASYNSNDTLYIGDSDDDTTVVIRGNLQVDGTTTTINSTTLTVDDKTIELASLDSPSDTTASNSGIVVRGTTNKYIMWVNDSNGGSWTLSHRVISAQGTAAAPVYTFSGDEDTGIYKAASDTVGIAAGGSAAATVSSTGITAAGFIVSGSTGFLKADGSVDTSTYLTSLGSAIVDADFTDNGLMKRTDAGTYTSITDNSSNWNDAFSWGDHSTEGYLVSSDVSGTYAPIASPTFTGTLTTPVAYIGATGSNPQIQIYTQDASTSIADTFADTTTDKSYIQFSAGTSSNDPGYIMHETSESETNEGVIHLAPSDDNADTDYVSIHGTNDPDALRLTTAGLIETASNYQLRLKSGSGNVKVNDNFEVTGNVGIGVATPNANLHVYNTGNGEIEVERASGALVNIQAQSAKGVIGTDSNHPLSLKTNASERLTILNTGNVGIGTTSPSSLLHLSSSGPTLLTLEADTDNATETDNVYIHFKQDAGLVNAKAGIEGTGGVTFTGSLDNTAFFGGDQGVQLYTAGTAKFTLKGDGKIGIGTNSPDSLLHIADTTTMTSGQSSVEVVKLQRIDSTGDIKASTEGHISMWATDSNSNEEWARISWLNDNSSDSGAENEGSLHFWTNSSGTLTRALSINHDQNVGIGTDSPSERLHVKGPSSGTTYVNIQAGGASLKSGLKLSQTYGGNAYYSEIVSDWVGEGTVFQACRDLSNTQGGFVFKGADGDRLMVLRTNSGNVGIGTTSPSNKLEVAGSDTTGITVSGGTNGRNVQLTSSGLAYSTTSTSGYAMGNYVVKNSDGSTLGQIAGAYGNPNTLQYTYYGGTAYNNAAMYITPSNKKVGIGTTAPSKKLHVSDGSNEVAYFEGTGASSWIDIKGASTELWSIGAYANAFGIFNRTDSSYYLQINNDGAVSTSGTLTVGGDLYVNGTTTTINSTTVTVDDKNIELGSVSSPTDSTADGGGITLKGATDKKLTWIGSSDAWVFNTNLDVQGNIKLNGVTTLDATSVYTRVRNAEGSVALYLGDSGDRGNYYDNNNHYFRNAGGGTDYAQIDSNGFRVEGNIYLAGDVTTTNQARTIDFTGFDKEGTTDFSDRAYISHTTNTGGHTGSVLVISSKNDSNDGIAFETASSSNLKHNGNTIWTAGNDGASSGLDADLLDGQHGSYYLNYNNFSNTPSIPSAANNATITLTGGGGITTTIGNFTTDQSSNETLTISHADTSSQSSVNNSDGTVIQDVTLDTYGHVTGLASANLDDRYSRRYEGSASSVSSSGYTTVATVSGSSLMSAIRMTVGGTANNVVVANVVDIVVNHYQDIQVEALSGNYTRLYVKIISNNDDAYAIQVKTNSTQATTLYFNILALHEETVTFTSSHSYTGATLEVDCESGKVIKGTGGDDGDIKSHGVFRGNGSGLSNVDADTLDGINSSGFLRSNTSDTYTSGTLTFASGTKLDLSTNDAYANMRVIRNESGGMDDGLFIGYGNAGGSSAPTRIYGGGSTNVHLNVGATNISFNGNNILTTADEGSGNGLDADTLDGQHGSYYLDYNNFSNTPSIPTYSTATSSTLGLVKIGYTENGKNYPVELSNGQMYVNVPWTDTNTVYSHPTHPGDDFSVDSGPLTGATVISDIDINVTTDTLGHVTDANGTIATRTLTAANLGISAPNAPSNVSVSVVGETVSVSFDASTTSGIDSYLVYSSVDGSDYGLISIIPPDDFSATMEIIDQAFTVTGTQAYRVYAMKYGIMSSAATGSVSYTVSSAEPTDMTVVPLNNAYFVQWNPPSSNERFVTAYNVYKHEAAQVSSLARGSASLVYSGLNTNFMYQISGSNNNNYHQFWVETTIA